MPQVKITLSVDFPPNFFVEDEEHRDAVSDGLELVFDKFDAYIDEIDFEQEFKFEVLP